MRVTFDGIRSEVDALVAETSFDKVRALNLVFLKYLQYVNTPVELAPALEVADAYWRYGVGSPATLSQTKAEVWRYFRAAHPGYTNMYSPDRRAAQIVLFVLTAERDEEAYWDSLEWFCFFFNGDSA